MRGVITQSAVQGDSRHNALLSLVDVTLVGYEGGDYYALEACGKCKTFQVGKRFPHLLETHGWYERDMEGTLRPLLRWCCTQEVIVWGCIMCGLRRLYGLQYTQHLVGKCRARALCAARTHHPLLVP